MRCTVQSSLWLKLQGHCEEAMHALQSCLQHKKQQPRMGLCGLFAFVEGAQEQRRGAAAWLPATIPVAV